MYLDSNSQVMDYRLKTRRLVIPFSITGHATPASKTLSTDIPDAMVISAEGLTATATAIDSGTNFTTAVDATNAVFSLLVYNLGTVTQIKSAQVLDQGNTASGTAIAVARKGASSTGITASGNVALSVTYTGFDAATENLSAVLILDYKV